MISLYELLWQFCFKKVQLFHIFSWKWRPRSLCVSRIYTANQWIDVYHAHFTGERKLYVKTGHIYKVTATNLSIDLGTRGEIVYAQVKIFKIFGYMFFLYEKTTTFSYFSLKVAAKKSMCVPNLYSQSMNRCIPCSFHWGKEAVRQDWSHLQSDCHQLINKFRTVLFTVEQMRGMWDKVKLQIDAKKFGKLFPQVY